MLFRSCIPGFLAPSPATVHPPSRHKDPPRPKRCQYPAAIPPAPIWRRPAEIRSAFALTSPSLTPHQAGTPPNGQQCLGSWRTSSYRGRMSLHQKLPALFSGRRALSIRLACLSMSNGGLSVLSIKLPDPCTFAHQILWSFWLN